MAPSRRGMGESAAEATRSWRGGRASGAHAPEAGVGVAEVGDWHVLVCWCMRGGVGRGWV